MKETQEEVHYDNRVMGCYRNRPSAITQLLEHAVEIKPTGDALIHEQTRLSYYELNQRVEALARGLCNCGIGKGDRIALLLGNRPEFVITVLAAARLEAISVPLNVRLQTPELEYVLTHCGASLLVHEAEIASRLPQAHDVPALKYCYVAGGGVEGSTPFDELLQEADTLLPAIQPNEEDVAVILYTSGTTGRPKGATLTHLGIVHSAMHFTECMQLTQADRSIMPVPASHVTGLIANILSMINVAGCTVMLPVFKARKFLELAQEERITHTLMVPAMYNLCLMEPAFDSYDLSTWRIGGYGGAPMPEATIEKLAQRLPQLELVNAYGATETTSPATVMPVGGTAEHSDSVGKAVPCGELSVRSLDGDIVAPGETGEIWIKGPMVVPGYWNNAEATQASFTHGYWRSGDVGSLDADGYLRVFDRLKDVINRGGYKIYSVEVENILNHHPDVVECAVVARDDPVLGEKIAAVVVCLRQSQTSAEELKRFCADRIADYKVPDFIFFRNEPLQRNAAGKLLKRQLREDILLEELP